MFYAILTSNVKHVLAKMKMGGHFHEMAGKCQVSDCYHKHCIMYKCRGPFVLLRLVFYDASVKTLAVRWNKTNRAFPDVGRYVGSIIINQP